MGNGADNEALEALIYSGRGNFFENVTPKDLKSYRSVVNLKDNDREVKTRRVLKSIFDERSIYDITSGREMATYLQSSHNFKSIRRLFADAQPKLTSREKDFSLTLMPNYSGNLSRAPGDTFYRSESQIEKGLYSVDYDIIVPWILRNILRSCTDKNDQTNSAGGIGLLEDFLHTSDTSRIGIFLVAELKIILGELGIRVTTDVLQELCRRFPGSMSRIREKWDWVENMKEIEEKKSASSYLKDLNSNNEDKVILSNDSSSRADSKNQSKECSPTYTSSSKYIQYDDDDDDDDEKNVKSSKSASKSSNRMKVKPEKTSNSFFYSSLLLEKADENLGLDIHLLIINIGKNRNLNPGLDTNRMTENSVRILNLTDNEINLNEINNTGPIAEHLNSPKSDQQRGSHFNTIACHESVNANIDDISSIILPSCLTLSAIMKARRNVINVCDSRGRSPLLVASALGLKRAVVTLLAQGGDISLATEDGHNTFTVAKTPIIRALPTRTLLTWMNKREHSSTRLEGCQKIQRNGKQLSDTGDLFLKTSELQSERFHLDDTLAGSINRSKLAQEGELKVANSDELQRGSARNVMLSNGIGPKERARVVSGLVGQLESLQGSNWAYSRPPLMWAVHNGLLSAVEGMLPLRALSHSLATTTSPLNDPNCCDTVGRGPLHECAALVRSGRTVLVEDVVSIAEALIAAGARLNDVSVSGRTPLHELFCSNQDETVSTFRVSSEFKAAVCVTAVHRPHSSLVSRNRRLLLRSLLHLGANPLLLDRHGMAPIHYCVREDYADCLLEILRLGYDGTFRNKFSQSPLHVACKAGAVRSAHLLCRWDADHISSRKRPISILQQKDGQGKSPAQLLHHSDSSRCLETLWGACRAGDFVRWRSNFF